MVSTTSTVSHTSLTSICPGHGPVASTPVNSVQTLLPYLGACPLLKMGKHHEHAEFSREARPLDQIQMANQPEHRRYLHLQNAMIIMNLHSMKLSDPLPINQQFQHSAGWSGDCPIFHWNGILSQNGGFAPLKWPSVGERHGELWTHVQSHGILVLRPSHLP